MKPVIYILVFIFSFISFGMSVTFFSGLSHFRADMKKQVHEDNHPQCLTFSHEAFANLKWEEKDKEFRLNGKMFDVSKVVVKDNEVLVYCLFDKDETSLRKKLANLFSDKPGNKSPFRLWVQILAQNYFTPPELSLPALHRDFNMIQSPYIFRIHTFENELADPPPRG